MRRDGMGPDNLGPGTGRGLGNCSPSENIENHRGFGFRISERGFGPGSGRGMGRGRRKVLGRGMNSRRGMEHGGRR